jgi:hydroxyethylthiazole kinase-like uncharacterized protein yjeF
MSAARHAANAGAEVTIALLHPEADSCSDFATLLEVCGCMDLSVILLSDSLKARWREERVPVLVLGCSQPEADAMGERVIDLTRFEPSDAWTGDLPQRCSGGEGALSARAVREIDGQAIAEYGLPGVCLMENAGIGALRVAQHLRGEDTRPVAILAGKGNNGGDAFVVARGVLELGAEVRVLLLAQESALRGDALVNYLTLKEAGVEIQIDCEGQGMETMLDGCGLVVDGLLGTGIKGQVQGPVAHSIEVVNGSGLPVLALDIPSGLDADSGESHGAVIRAAATVTFAAVKTGLVNGMGPECCGDLYLAPIGCPTALLEGGSA